MNTPANIGDSVGPPVVSVLLVTYNHERFIAQAIEGALSQRTTFPVEIVIGDDASNDGTRDIVLEFAAKHPDRIRTVLRAANGGPMANFSGILGACRGEFVAILDGDDHWTDPEKLAVQVDQLRSRAEASMSFHSVNWVSNETGRVIGSSPPVVYRPTDPSGFFQWYNPVATCSIVYRRSLVPTLPEWFHPLKLGDWPLVALLSTFGPALFTPRVMGTYRVHGRSMWSGKPLEERLAHTVSMFNVLAAHLREPFRHDATRAAAMVPLHTVQELLHAGKLDQARRLLQIHMGAITKAGRSRTPAAYLKALGKALAHGPSCARTCSSRADLLPDALFDPSGSQHLQQAADPATASPW